jgi:FAD/FMN-containing dehydrogenase
MHGSGGGDDNSSAGVVVATTKTALSDLGLDCDWTKHWKCSSGGVDADDDSPTEPGVGSVVALQPTTVQQVADVLQYCSQQRIAVIPVGGNTGLVGGTMPVIVHPNSDGTKSSSSPSSQQSSFVFVSTRKLSKIHSLDESSGILHTDAGVLLQDLQEFTAQRDCMVPIDLGARGSCCIGGNIATNAGGQYFYRYGSIPANLLGLQVVTGSGTILNLNYDSSSGINNSSNNQHKKSGCNIKDNTGYKLHQIFVGSEGTLGIITGVSLLCRPVLRSRHAALLACPTFSDVLETMAMAKRNLGETLAALEWMDSAIVTLVQCTHEHSIRELVPFLQDAEKRNTTSTHYLLVESHGSHPDHDREKMDLFLEMAMNSGTVSDGIHSQDVQQSRTFWNLRELCNPAAAASGYTYKYDVSLPGSQFEGFVDEMRQRLSSSLSGVEATVANWGHVLDGNLHFNVTTVGNFEKDPDVFAMLEPYVFEAVHRHRGSISAEHGIGQAKTAYMNMIHTDETIDTMRAIKAVFDPAGILNPGKVLPP